MSMPICASCGTELTPGLADGLCPRCLMAELAQPPSAETVAPSPVPTKSGPPPGSPAAQDTGRCVGPYTLLEQIGEGGMGAVYLAEQTSPVRRQVALKIIKPGMDSRQVIARFETERQALALMEHPNIARVFEAGTTAGGRPYFAMELVKGLSVTEYCELRKLTLHERIQLVIPVCHAIQHAHHKGVIHRDIKPSNVLVADCDGLPVAKVIDFGVAKAARPHLTGDTMLTEAGQILGTIDYMSPEQARLRDNDIDTRTDIYSLGVLLYELLTGDTPFDRNRLRAAALDEMLRIIREEDPPKPSTRISHPGIAPSAAPDRSRNPRTSSTLRGELDWIVMKCLAKERDRRYETAADLARDLERFLVHEPVLAGPPSTGYRLRKFVRRNRTALSGAGFLLAVLVALGGSIGWTIRDRGARQALLEERIVQAFADEETSRLIGDLSAALAAVKRAEDLLASGAKRRDFEQSTKRRRKDLELAAQLELISLEGAAVKDELFDQGAADRAFRRAFAQYGIDVETLNPEEAAGHIRSSPVAPQLIAALDNWAAAKTSGMLPGKEHLLAVANKADADRWRRRFRNAYLREDWFTVENLAKDPEIQNQQPQTLSLLASVLRHGAQNIPLAVEVLRTAHRRYPRDFWISHDLAQCLQETDPSEAAAFFRVAVALHPASPGARLNLGSALLRQDRLEEAELEYREAIRQMPSYAMAYRALGDLLADRDRLREAETMLRTAVRLRPDDPVNLGHLSQVLQMAHRWSDAESILRDALRMRPEDAMLHNNLGMNLMEQNQLAEAEASLREAVRLRPRLALIHFNLGALLAQQGRWAEAETAYRDGLRLEPGDALVRNDLGFALMQQGKRPEAIETYREALRYKPDYHVTRYNLGFELMNSGELESAEAELREAVRCNPEFVDAYGALAYVLRGLGKPGEAEEVAQDAARINPTSPVARGILGSALNFQGKVQDAEAEFMEMIRLNPADASSHRNLGAIREQQRRWEEAKEAYREALRLDPNDEESKQALHALEAWETLPQILSQQQQTLALDTGNPAAHFAVAHTHAQLGQWELAAKALSHALQLDPGDHFWWFRAAALHLETGDLAGYERVCREMVERFSSSGQPEIAERISKVCLLGPSSPRQRERAIALAGQAATAPESHGYYWYFMLNKAHADYRTENYSSALEWLKRCAPPRGLGSHDAFAFALLAMTHHQLEQFDEARKALYQARVVASKAPYLDKRRPFGDDWHDWLLSRVIMREAEQLIQKDS